MKRISTLLLASAISIVATAQSSSVYPGNRSTGFGNVIGGSTLTITENASTLAFTLDKGSGGFNDALVLYLDVVAGGENSTINYTDNGQPALTAISGFSSTGLRSLLTFPTGFGADFAIVADPLNTVSGLYALNTNAGHTFKQDAGLSPLSNNSSVYTFSISKSSIGFATGLASFKFLGTYLNSGASTYRSNEGYGTLTFTGVPDANGNPGYSIVTATSFFSYPTQVLPVRLLSFSGNVLDSKGKLNWQVANDNEVSKYEIEKSVNSKDFTALQAITARRTTAAQNYTIEDTKLSGTNYYRLKTTDLQGVVSYSKVVQLSIGVKGQGFTIFPNPVQQTLNIKTAKLDKGQYDVNVYSASGQLVFAKAIQYDGSGNTIQVELPANLQKGNYNCILNSASGKFSSNFLKQ